MKFASTPPKSHDSDEERRLPSKPLISQGIFWFYGSAAIAFGIKDNAFSYLLLTYCDHVLKMPGYLAARAMAIALIWDAIWDVFVGHLSDKTSSTLGRRHPYMYASLFVFPPSFFALFHPMIELTPTNSFTYILVMAVIVRMGTTLFEIPSAALLPDLEQDYERRNRWLALRYSFGWYGGNGLHMLNFACWVGAYGDSSQVGYSIYASAGAMIISLTILTSSLGTQETMKTGFVPSEPFKLRDMAHEIRQVFQSVRNANFQALFFYGIVQGVSGGLGSALTLYNMTYFYVFSGKQIAFVSVGILVSPALANVLAPHVGVLLGKKAAAMCSLLASMLIGPIPSILVLLGFWPTLGSWHSVSLYMLFAIVMVVLMIISGVMTDSMIADVVEDGEVNTSRRSEGLYFAARGFAGKAISGGGIIFAGNIVSFVGLDKVQSAAEMTWLMRYKLVKFIVPITFVLQCLALLLLSQYRIGLQEHSANLAKLAERKFHKIATSSRLERSMDEDVDEGVDQEQETDQFGNLLQSSVFGKRCVAT